MLYSATSSEAPAARPYAPTRYTPLKILRQYFLLLRVLLAEYRSSWIFHIVRSLLFPLSFAFIVSATSRDMSRENAIFLLGGVLTASLAFGPVSTLIVKLGWSRQNREFDYWVMQPMPKLVLILAIVSVALLFVLPGLFVTYSIASLLLGLPLSGSVMLLVLIPLASAAFSGMAAFLGCYARGGQAATMIANITTIIIGFLSPLFIPLYRFPLPLRLLAQLLPFTYAADALRSVLGGHMGVGLPIDVCILLVYAIASVVLVQIKLDWRAVA
ncbi:MAG: hypothetical protein NVS2B12_07880 [Ktedonobacteraceae bacterium]